MIKLIHTTENHNNRSKHLYLVPYHRQISCFNIRISEKVEPVSPHRFSILGMMDYKDTLRLSSTCKQGYFFCSQCRKKRFTEVSGRKA